jgi:hypothetical protein
MESVSVSTTLSWFAYHHRFSIRRNLEVTLTMLEPDIAHQVEQQFLSDLEDARNYT